MCNKETVVDLVREWREGKGDIYGQQRDIFMQGRKSDMKV